MIDGLEWLANPLEENQWNPCMTKKKRRSSSSIWLRSNKTQVISGTPRFQDSFVWPWNGESADYGCTMGMDEPMVKKTYHVHYVVHHTGS